MNRLYTPLLIVAVLNGAVPLPKAYHDKRTELIVHYPAGWTIDENWPSLTLINFPANQRPKQSIVPLHGAEIMLMKPPADRDVASISDWLSLDRVTEKDGVSRGDLTTVHLGTIQFASVTYEEPLIPEGRGRTFYLKIGGRLFKVNLFYRDKARSKEMEDTFVSIVENLEPDPGH